MDRYIYQRLYDTCTIFKNRYQTLRIKKLSFLSQHLNALILKIVKHSLTTL